MYAIYMNTNMLPSRRPIECFFPMRMEMKRMRVATNTSPISMLLLLSNGRGRMVALIPSTQRILNIFDPTTFPMAMSVLRLYAAMAEVASSGRDVPMATTVSPMTVSLIPNEEAMVTALSTIHFPPTMSPMNPRRTKIESFQVACDAPSESESSLFSGSSSLLIEKI